MNISSERFILFFLSLASAPTGESEFMVLFVQFGIDFLWKLNFKWHSTSS